MGNVMDDWHYERGRFSAFMEVKNLITKERADIDDVYLFLRNKTLKIEEEREECGWQE